mmetsp:Transcript_14955/g.62238  ORF Transcript_14955/g.62238 Transcript_14955/m.62238 type:complete len:235 (-) Transcript_14955:894-1598(-)
MRTQLSSALLLWWASATTVKSRASRAGETAARGVPSWPRPVRGVAAAEYTALSKSAVAREARGSSLSSALGESTTFSSTPSRGENAPLSYLLSERLGDSPGECISKTSRTSRTRASSARAASSRFCASCRALASLASASASQAELWRSRSASRRAASNEGELEGAPCTATPPPAPSARPASSAAPSRAPAPGPASATPAVDTSDTSALLEWLLAAVSASERLRPPLPSPTASSA